MGSFRFFLSYVAVPFLIGLALSWRHLEAMHEWWLPLFTAASSGLSAMTAGRSLNSNDNVSASSAKDSSSAPATTPTVNVDACYSKLLQQLQGKRKSSTSDLLPQFEQLSIVMHRNGQADACAEAATGNHNIAESFKSVLTELLVEGVSCPRLDEKYAVESLLTRLFHLLLSDGCYTQEDTADRTRNMGLLGYCDMGPANTPILLDHAKLVPVSHSFPMARTPQQFLPCHFHNAHGVRVTSFRQLSELARTANYGNRSSTALCGGGDNDKDGKEAETCAANLSRELHLYAVPAGRVFMHSAAYIGQIIDLPHVRGGDPNKPVYLEVLSVSPAVYDLHNFFTRDESAELVTRALSETKESHRIKRSTTGNVGHNINNRRTSESGFDTDGATSIALKRYVLLGSGAWFGFFHLSD
jgi:hypothetical protein